MKTPFLIATFAALVASAPASAATLDVPSNNAIYPLPEGFVINLLDKDGFSIFNQPFNQMLINYSATALQPIDGFPDVYFADPANMSIAGVTFSNDLTTLTLLASSYDITLDDNAWVVWEFGPGFFELGASTVAHELQTGAPLAPGQPILEMVALNPSSSAFALETATLVAGSIDFSYVTQGQVFTQKISDRSALGVLPAGLDPQPAPIPLPATLPMLLGALGLAALSARRV